MAIVRVIDEARHCASLLHFLYFQVLTPGGKLSLIIKTESVSRIHPLNTYFGSITQIGLDLRNASSYFPCDPILTLHFWFPPNRRNPRT